MTVFIVLVFVQLLFTWSMLGVTAFSQIVHYPLYQQIKEGFVQYEKSHLRRAGSLVGPIMLLEAITAIFLVGFASQGPVARLTVINLILLIFIWLTTFLLSVYQHQRLSVRFSKQVLHELISSNWINAILWLAKGVVLTSILWLMLKA